MTENQSRQQVCLALYNEKGRVVYQHWYSSLNSARASKSRLAYMFGYGYVWVIWAFDKEGNQLLLSSSRPLKFEFVKQNELL